ncbi:PhpK family radical SAM P-methyltransferase [Rhizobium laguerreae]|uniref:PhpK family radical SAM P-methyltransferase n=1 Tax=Rhizobium laguerreae TaxID=1076926 RepID=UPI001C90968E|nr:PhpK family radical SAM P-methyltransferase [Rhizobium laguerreae]MBY3203469.1 PhpK family radical SAM P-methyltransferase [Rhizobium laguerreae]
MASHDGDILDCLILGFYETQFEDYVDMLRSMGSDNGAFKDLALAYVEIDGRPMRALDVLSHFHDGGDQRFHNADFLWPVVAYLTAYLHERGLRIDYVNLPHLEGPALYGKLAGPVRAVAITTTVYVSPQPILALIEEIRDINHDVTIIVGGPYLSNQAALLDQADLRGLFDYLGADIYVLAREGEATLAGLLAALRDGTSLREIANIAFWDEGDFRFTETCAENNGLSGNIIDYRPFARDTAIEFLSLRTAKSCPFACAFCGFPERAGDYQFLDVPGIVRQLDAVEQLRTVSTVSFIDDTFNVPKKRFKDILRVMIERGYGFKWNCFYRADHGDDETIALMAEAGCEGVFLGVESGSDALLSLMNKTARRHHYLQAIRAFRDVGINTYASLIVGFPGETADTVMETIEFLNEARPDYYRAQLWYADPLTPVLRRRTDFAIAGSGFAWSHASMDVKEACRWIDRVFLEVDQSVWLPQFGFEPWSLYYLLRKGMSRTQIRNFVECFNRGVRHRIETGSSEYPKQHLEGLRQSCQFDRKAAPARLVSLGPSEDHLVTGGALPLALPGMKPHGSPQAGGAM